MVQEVKVLNVAEKPSVARALAAVFNRMPGARDRGMRREAHQIFTHENVNFPSVLAQGDGSMIQGPSECAEITYRCTVFLLLVMTVLLCVGVKERRLAA